MDQVGASSSARLSVLRHVSQISACFEERNRAREEAVGDRDVEWMKEGQDGRIGGSEWVRFAVLYCRLDKVVS